MTCRLRSRSWQSRWSGTGQLCIQAGRRAGLAVGAVGVRPAWRSRLAAPARHHMPNNPRSMRSQQPGCHYTSHSTCMDWQGAVRTACSPHLYSLAQQMSIAPFSWHDVPLGQQVCAVALVWHRAAVCTGGKAEGMSEALPGMIVLDCMSSTAVCTAACACEIARHYMPATCCSGTQPTVGRCKSASPVQQTLLALSHLAAAVVRGRCRAADGNLMRAAVPGERGTAMQVNVSTLAWETADVVFAPGCTNKLTRSACCCQGATHVSSLRRAEGCACARVQESGVTATTVRQHSCTEARPMPGQISRTRVLRAACCVSYTAVCLTLYGHACFEDAAS